MTINNEIIDLSNAYLERLSSEKFLKNSVLVYFLNTISIVNREDSQLKQFFPSQIYKRISEKTSVSIPNIENIIKNFMRDIYYFRKFLANCFLKHNPKNPKRKLRIYLHKIHKIAPIFDFKRARKNILPFLRLSYKCHLICQLSTQVARIIYITNQKGGDDSKILQKNIRAITGCSAYAYHRTRNKLKIDTYL